MKPFVSKSGWKATLKRPCSPPPLSTFAPMSRNAVVWRAPFFTRRTRPGCSTMKSRFGSSGGAVTCVGCARPEATSPDLIAVPLTVGMPAQMADVFSSWQVAEQPSPLVVLPSSHSSVPSTTPLPQVGEAPATEWSVGSTALASVAARASSEQRRCIGPPVERGDRTLLPSSALDVNVRSCTPPVERRSGGVYRGRMASAGDSFHTRSVLEVGGTKFLIHRLDALGARAARLPFSLKILLENLLRGEA